MTTQTNPEVELDNAREALRSAHARLSAEAENVQVTVEYGFTESGEPHEDRDIAYDDEFVAAVVAVKQARARITDLELRAFEASNA